MNFKEAIRYGKKEHGVTRQQLCEALYPNTSFNTATHNLSNLCTGKNKKVDIEAVTTICSLCKVSADYLFGLTDDPTPCRNFTQMRSAVLDAMSAAETTTEAINYINSIIKSFSNGNRN